MKRTDISFIFMIGIISLSVGCSATKITASAGSLTQAEVDSIIVKCRAPKSMVVIEKGQLTILRGEDLSVFGCVFDALYETGKTTLSMVGNQRYDTPKGR